jgi:hypothetical protein
MAVVASDSVVLSSDGYPCRARTGPTRDVVHYSVSTKEPWGVVSETAALSLTKSTTG